MTIIAFIILAFFILWLLTWLLTFTGVTRRPILPILVLGLEGEVYLKWWRNTWVKPHGSKWHRE